MGFSSAQTYLSDILHVVSQSLLAPDIILLLAFILYSLFSVGSVIAEYFTERRHFKVVMPRFLAALMASKEEDIPQVIEHSGLLNRQKEALNTIYEYRALEGDALVALVRRLVNEEETRYDRITGRNNTAAKVSPMLGLMGTLIPLGPGIQALGTADTAALSSSLLVAFDTTVAGLVTAAICLVVGKIRSNWYNNYLSALDAAMATMMEKIEEGRATSTATLPEGAESYTFLFGIDEKEDKAKGAEKAEAGTAVDEAAEGAEADASGQDALGVAAPAAAAFVFGETATQADENLDEPAAQQDSEWTFEAVEQATEPIAEPVAEDAAQATELVADAAFDAFAQAEPVEQAVAAADEATEPVAVAADEAVAEATEPIAAVADEVAESFAIDAPEAAVDAIAEATEPFAVDFAEEVAEPADTVVADAGDAAELPAEETVEEAAAESGVAEVFAVPEKKKTLRFGFNFNRDKD